MIKNHKFSFVVLLLILLTPLLDLFRSGLPLTHDGQDHVARIANFYQSLADGNIIPRWAGNLNWGYGHPILMFLYPLPSFIASFFHFAGFSFVESTKIVFGLGFVLSDLFMYLWIKTLLGNKAGIASAIVYTFAPYRFVDLYVRGAIGENLAFVWLPLACFFVLRLSQKVRVGYFAGLCFSLAALILSHNALSMMFLPVIGAYAVFLVFGSKEKPRLFVLFMLSFVLGFMLSSFYWMPAFFEGKYTLRDVVIKGNLTGFSDFTRFVWSAWSYGGTGSLSVQIGFIQWLMILISPLIIWQFKVRHNPFFKFLGFLLLAFWASIFLMLPVSKPIYQWIPTLQKFQFVWRFLSLAIFPPAVFAGALVFLLKKKQQSFILCLIISLSLFLNRNYWQAKDFLQRQDAFFASPYAGTTDTGESAPRWSVRFMENFPTQPLEIIEGSAEVDLASRKTNEHIYRVAAQKESRLVENTLYFPGWQVFVNGKPVPVEFQDQKYRGLMTFTVPAGDSIVKVSFGETKLRRFADLISLLGLGFLVGTAILKIRFWVHDYLTKVVNLS